MQGKVFDRIEALKNVATKAELRLIDGLKQIKKEDIIYMSITELAGMLDVAEATLLRFCRKLEYRGFQDFKLSLSQEIGAEEDKESELSLSKRVANDMMDAITGTYKQFDYEKCVEVAEHIIRAKRVCAFGVGNSAIAPLMFKNRLAKAGVLVENTTDTHQQSIIASNLGEEDVLLLVSVSGATKDILSVAELAKQNGTLIVVLTNYDKSPIAKYADYAFFNYRKEAAYVGGSLATVVAQSYIVDMLCNAVFECIGEESCARAMKASMAVSDKSI